MKKCILTAVFLCGFLFTQAFSSNGQVNLDDAMIALTFKGLAKAFIATQNKDKLIEKLNSLDNKKFRIKYARAYKAIKGSPSFTLSYGFRDDMAKEELIKKIKSWNKKKMFEIIDAIPDEIISVEFKRYLNAKTAKSQKGEELEQVAWTWNEIIERLGIK